MNKWWQWRSSGTANGAATSQETEEQKHRRLRVVAQVTINGALGTQETEWLKKQHK